MGREALDQPAIVGDAVDRMVKDLDDEWRPVIDPLTAAVERLLAEVASLDEFRRRLPELVQRFDAAGQPLAERLTRLGFAATIAGGIGLDLDDDGTRS